MCTGCVVREGYFCEWGKVKGRRCCVKECFEKHRGVGLEQCFLLSGTKLGINRCMRSVNGLDFESD